MDEPSARAAPGRAPARAADDVAEFTAFYRAFMPRLVAFLRYQGASLPDATDVAQEAMTAAFAQWSAIVTPRAWVKRVASRMWGRRLASVETKALSDRDGSLVTISDVAEWEQRHEILRILDGLPSRQRQVLAWTLDGHSPAEIAEELQLSSETVRANLYQARRAVAKHLGSDHD